MLPLSFYENKSTVSLARDLLGTILVHQSDEGVTTGKIIETEAYLFNDPASHSFKGKTKRNFCMFGPAGTAYIYQIYGLHYCFNVVSKEENIGEAVLIRSLEPLEGLDLMKERRKLNSEKNLCNGPGKLVAAMGITSKLNGIKLISPQLHLLPTSKQEIKIISSPRVGISQATELHYRFYLEGNKFVSYAPKKIKI